MSTGYYLSDFWQESGCKISVVASLVEEFLQVSGQMIIICPPPEGGTKAKTSMQKLCVHKESPTSRKQGTERFVLCWMTSGGHLLFKVSVSLSVTCGV